MKIGTSTIDFKGLQIDGPQGLLSIEPKVMKLLRVLTENVGEVMTRGELISAVWGVQYGGDESLSRGISILRKALGDKKGQHKYIVTISRVGYRFIGDSGQGAAGVELQQIKSDPIEMKPNQSASIMAVEAKALTSDVLKVPILSSKMFKRAALIMVGCVLFGAFIFFGARSGETLSLQAKMDQGFSHIENFTPKGAIDEAQDIFSGILVEDPSHAAARAGLAFAIFREYTHLERDPALLQRGTAHAEAALREDEHLALANIAVAWAAVFGGDLERSNKYLDRADILDPNNRLALEARYGAFLKEGEVEKAEALMDEAIEAYPEHSLFYAYRASISERKGKYTDSEKDFRKAILLSPDNSRTYAALAHSLHLQNRTDEAISVIQQGLNINETALLYNNLGTYLFFQGQYDLAASAFEKTLELGGDSHDYLYWANLGDAYRWSDGKKDEAPTSYRRALQLLQADLDRYPNDDNLKSRAAMFNAKLGDLDKAQNYMDSFNLFPESPAIQLYRAVVTYEIMSNRTKALEYLEAVINADYPMIEILNDPELSLLRQDPAYHKLLAKP